MNPSRSQGEPPAGCIVLIGHRGCGKTTVGRVLAQRLGWRFVDLDAEIELRADRSIADIFSQQGEPTFRKLESETLLDLLGRSNITDAASAMNRLILSTGGGVVLDPANRVALRSHARCIWLRANAEELNRRMKADSDRGQPRPALTKLDPQAETAHLLAERSPLYAELAHDQIDTDSRTIAETVDAIVTALEASRVSPHGSRDHE